MNTDKKLFTKKELKSFTAVQAIDNEVFIKWLELKLTESKAGNATFNKFNSCLWDFLCYSKPNIIRKLSKILGNDRNPLNIGEIRHIIFDKLGLLWAWESDLRVLTNKNKVQ
ncbi:hypothetical protein [Galbibacter sp. BG1]